MLHYVPLIAQGTGGQFGIAIGGNPLILFLAISAILGGVGLYFVRNWRPELSRDHDIFLAAVAFIYGLVLLFYSFRIDQITQFAQLLLVGFGWWFGFETLSLRQVVSTQARRASINQPIEEDEPMPPEYDYPEYDYSREIPERRSVRQPRQMPPYRPSELYGDVDREVPRRPRRTRSKPKPPSDNPVIDVLDEDIKPVAPRRPRSKSGRNSDSPTSRRRNNADRSNYPEIDPSEREDY
ncbi:MAG: hypothetical protein CV045_10335 [Cyanobacteria bacterium M5B4]|nr:MAG: hypothetical protein CV045_10335 [Cyanobacteria bacterium M5B4]